MSRKSNINRLSVIRDLFGELPPPEPKMGRPVRVFTAPEILMVRQMLAAGMYQAEIIKLLNVSEPTLRKYFKSSPHWNGHNGPHRTKRNRADKQNLERNK